MAFIQSRLDRDGLKWIVHNFLLPREIHLFLKRLAIHSLEYQYIFYIPNQKVIIEFHRILSHAFQENT